MGLEACFGLAGLDSPKDIEIMNRGDEVDEARPAARATDADDLVENDWRTAVTGAFIDEPGVTLIAGTGCVAAAQRDWRPQGGEGRGLGAHRGRQGERLRHRKGRPLRGDEGLRRARPEDHPAEADHDAARGERASGYHRAGVRGADVRVRDRLALRLGQARRQRAETRSRPRY